jgi:hypothetical protein
VFILSVPLFLAVLPPPFSEFDYLVVGSGATCFGLLTVLVILAHRQLVAFERRMPGDRAPGGPNSGESH